MPPAVKAALRQLPSVVERSSLLGSSGLLGKGLLGKGLLGTVIGDLQAGLGDPA